MTAEQNPLLNPLILHCVFTHLPQADLLLDQRVCRTWHHIISRSHSLQRRLFFRSARGKGGEDGGGADECIELNDLLVTHFSGFYQRSCHLRHGLGPFKATRWHEAAAQEGPDAATTTTRRRKTTQAYARPEASWRRMLPWQPPPRELQLVEVHNSWTGDRGVFRSFRPSSPELGVEFGLIYDTVQDWLFPSQSVWYGKRIEVRFPPASDRRTAEGEGKQEGSWWDIRRVTDALPDENFAGPDTAALWFTVIPQCRVGVATAKGVSQYARNYLRSDASVYGKGESSSDSNDKAEDLNFGGASSDGIAWGSERSFSLDEAF